MRFLPERRRGGERREGDVEALENVEPFVVDRLVQQLVDQLRRRREPAPLGIAEIDDGVGGNSRCFSARSVSQPASSRPGSMSTSHLGKDPFQVFEGPS